MTDGAGRAMTDGAGRALPRLVATLAVAVTAAVLSALPSAPTAARTNELTVEAIEVDTAPEISLRVVAPPPLVGEVLHDGDFTLHVADEFVPVEVRTARADDLDVVLALDTSGSMQGAPLEAAKSAATRFIARMPASARVAVVGFGDRPTVVSDFTDDPGAASAAVDGLEAAGETALFDALSEAAALVSASDAARTAVVMLSDGGDTVSTTSGTAAARDVAESRARFSAVALDSPEEDLSVLDGLADATSGAVVRASDSGALEEAFTRIAANLVDVYEVTATTAATGATDLRLTLEAGGTTAAAQRRVFIPGAPVASPPEQATPVGAMRPGVTIVPGFFERPVTLYAATGALLLGIGGLTVLLRPRRRPLQAGQRTPREAVSGAVDRVVAVTDAALDRAGRGASFDLFLESAGIALRTSEFVALTAAATSGAAVVGFILSGVPGAVLLAAAPLAAARVVPVLLTDRRRSAFSDNLSDTLQLLAGSLRAGYGLLQAIDTVARESASPTSEEFTRVVTETRLGRNLGASLRGLADRMDSPDFSWVVQAIEIHRDVGGDLAEVLDTVSGTIRERNQLQRQVKALSAEGRLSGLILVILPVALATVLAVTSPDYLGELVASPMGLTMLGIGAVLLVVGGLWITRITRLRY